VRLTLLFALALMPVSVLVMAWLQRTSLLVLIRKLSQCLALKQVVQLQNNCSLNDFEAC
jgi:hypothetical protein